MRVQNREFKKADYQVAAWNLAIRKLEGIAKTFQLEGTEEVVELMRARKNGTVLRRDQMLFPDIRNASQFEVLARVGQISASLRDTRIILGWNQRQFAEELGLKQQQIARYESTNYEIATLKRVIEIADFVCRQQELRLAQQHGADGAGFEFHEFDGGGD
jgi:hypothetical protein